MQVVQVTKEHPMQAIANGGLKPVSKSPVKAMTRDDMLAGTTLAAEVMATAVTQGYVWRGFALRLIAMPVEARVAFLNAIKANKGAMTKAQTEYGVPEKFAKGRTRSFGVNVSKLTTIANALNAGGSVTGWREFVNAQLPRDKQAGNDADMLANAGYETLVDYSRTFSQAKAGRTADTWLQKLGKFLERNKPAEDDDKGTKAYEVIVAEYNKLVA